MWQTFSREVRQSVGDAHPTISTAAFLVVAVAIGGLGSFASAQPGSPEKEAAKWINPPTDRAIQRGLAWLASRQHPDGSLGTGYYRGNVAVISLSGLAMMSGGSLPGRGPYGRQVSLSLDYVLAAAQESGFICVPGFESHGPMYAHGFATLFIAESLGSSPRQETREKLAKAVKLIVNTQIAVGGWRYRPERMDPDISVTISEVMALRAARNAGVRVPKETVDRSVEYIKKSQNADGGFTYMLLERGPSQFPAFCGRRRGPLYAGIYEGPQIIKGLD